MKNKLLEVEKNSVVDRLDRLRKHDIPSFGNMKIFHLRHDFVIGRFRFDDRYCIYFS